MNHLRNRFWVTAPTLLGLFLSVFSARADTINEVDNRSDLPTTETLDWSAFGTAFTGVTSNSSVTTTSGLIVTVSEPEYSLEVLQENTPGTSDGGYNGDFLPGQYLLTNWNSPFAVTLSFSVPVFGAGVQIEPAQVDEYPVPFTAYVTAYDGDVILGEFSTTGTKSNAHDGSAPFLGVTSDVADITSITYRIAIYANVSYTGDLGMNVLSLETSAPTPEPSGLLLIGSGLLFLACTRFRDRRFGGNV